MKSNRDENVARTYRALRNLFAIEEVLILLCSSQANGQMDQDANTGVVEDTWLPFSPFHPSQLSVTLGFPIIGKNLFSFGDVQNSRYPFRASSSTMSAPTPLVRRGNFTELLNPALILNAYPIVLYTPDSTTGSYSFRGSGQVGPTQALQMTTPAMPVR